MVPAHLGGSSRLAGFQNHKRAHKPQRPKQDRRARIARPLWFQPTSVALAPWVGAKTTNVCTDHKAHRRSPRQGSAQPLWSQPTSVALAAWPGSKTTKVCTHHKAQTKWLSRSEVRRIGRRWRTRRLACESAWSSDVPERRALPRTRLPHVSATPAGLAQRVLDARETSS